MNPLLLISIFYLTSSLTATAQVAGSENWPSFRGNPQLTGVSPAVISPPLKLLWSFKTDDAIKSSPVISNNTIFVGSDDGFLYAITSTGKLKWKFNAGSAIESPPLVVDNVVFVGSLEGVLFAVDATTGKQKWKYTTEGQISGSCNWTYGPDGKQKRILFGSYDYFFYCLDASNGKLLWKYESGNYINGAASVYGKNAVFGGCDGILHIVNTDNGKASGNIDIGTYIPASAAISGDLAFFGNYDGVFYCMDMKLKKVKWKTEGGGPFLA